MIPIPSDERALLIPCPTCRAPVTIPCRGLQPGFYHWARTADAPTKKEKP